MSTSLITTNNTAIAEELISGSRGLDKVSDLLMEQMVKLSGNPDEIPIAQAMSEIAARVIEVQKTKIAAAAVMVKAIN